MTNEEARKVIDREIDKAIDDEAYMTDEVYDALCVASMSLALQILKSQPCEDCISRKEVLDLATTIETDDYSGNEILEVVEVKEIKELPSVTPQPSEENILKFYYVEPLDDYWIGERMETMYYAKWNFELQDFVWTYSKYLPWGEHVVAPNTLWKEYTYPSEPKEIPFKEWIKGFLKKYGRRKKAK